MYGLLLISTLFLTPSSSEAQPPTVEVQSSVLHTWVRRLVTDPIEVRLSKSDDVQAKASPPPPSKSAKKDDLNPSSEIYARVESTPPMKLEVRVYSADAPKIRFNLKDLTSSPSGDCLETSHPSISCAIFYCSALAKKLAALLPKHASQIQQNYTRYKNALLWLRTRILSELGNNDLNELQLGVLQSSFVPQFRDLGLNPTVLSSEKLLAMKPKRFETLFYLETAPPENLHLLRKLGWVCVPLRSIQDDLSTEAYDRVTSHNMKTILDAVRFIGQARRHQRSQVGKQL